MSLSDLCPSCRSPLGENWGECNVCANYTAFGPKDNTSQPPFHYKMPDKVLRQTRRLSWVPRWAVHPTHRTQNVAEHSFGVCALTLWVLALHEQKNDDAFRCLCLTHAVTHDADEAVTGDAPSPTKDGRRKKAAALAQHEIVVKVADILEACVFMQEEILMGNHVYANPLMQDLQKRFTPYWNCFDYRKDEKKIDALSMIKMVCSLATQGPNGTPHPILEV